MTEELSPTQADPLPDSSLIIVEDDKLHLQRLKRALEARGFVVRTAGSVTDAVTLIHDSPPAFAVVDVRLAKGNGLDVIEELSRVRPTARAIVFTGYDSIATAVAAIKLGAHGYLAKPADADEIVNALLSDFKPDLTTPSKVLSADRVRWEHIQRVYELCNRNVSETARRLAMHRRTLQRVLSKRAPK